MVDQLDKEFWEHKWQEAYRTHRATVERRGPNSQLLAEAGGLSPGTALDAGCGVGGDAVWLAEQGWQVTAVDISTTALGHARHRSADAGVTDRIDWVEADLNVWTPPAERFDLVSSHYAHGVVQRDVFFGRLAAAVRPGGTLLIVGHHADERAADPSAPPPEVYFTVDEIVSSLDPAGWDIDVAETRTRADVDHDGKRFTRTDAVLRARKR